MFAIAIFISYNLQFYVAADILWPRLCRSSAYLQSMRKNLSSAARLWALEHIFRSALIVLTFCLAVTIPRIDLFISLIGSFSGSLLATIIPSVMDMIVFWPTCDYPKLKLAKNVMIILFGLYLLFAGTWISIGNIIAYIQSVKRP
jgi:proton-coupled amino acid transporter